MRILPLHLVSLVHYVELTESGWLDEANERYALTVLWSLTKPAPIQQIKREIEKNLSSDIKTHELEGALQRLVTKGEIHQLSDGRYVLNVDARTRLDELVKSAGDLEEHVKNLYCNRVVAVCPGLNKEEIWKLFIEKFMIPFVTAEGAKVYDNLVSHRQLSNWEPYEAEFSKQIPVAYRDLARQVTLDFFTENDPEFRKFLLSYLDTYFLVASSGVPAKVLKQLGNLNEQGIELSIFVDTNFVYSILGLHDNPSNEAATDLTDLVRSTSDLLKVHFFIIDRTLLETQQSIRYHKNRLSNVAYPSNVAAAALNSGVEISGVYKTFFERTKASGTRLSPEDYFEPYEKDLVRVLETKGVKVFPTQDSAKFEQTLDVIEDIENSLQYEKNRMEKRQNRNSRLLMM